MIIKEMSPGERPIEKMRGIGIKSLSNAELLAILLGSGTKRKSAIRLAEEILSIDKLGVKYLPEISVDELEKINGIKSVKAGRIIAAIELGQRIAKYDDFDKNFIMSTNDVVSRFMEPMRYLKKEYFNCLMLNAKGMILQEDNISIGDLSSSIVHPREAFSGAVGRNAAAVIFVHNHPSGDPEPSPEDINTTNRLSEAGRILGITVLDHVIIGDGVYSSFKERGIL